MGDGLWISRLLVTGFINYSFVIWRGPFLLLWALSSQPTAQHVRRAHRLYTGDIIDALHSSDSFGFGFSYSSYFSKSRMYLSNCKISFFPSVTYTFISLEITTYPTFLQFLHLCYIYTCTCIWSLRCRHVYRPRELRSFFFMISVKIPVHGSLDINSEIYASALTPDCDRSR